MDKLKVLIVEDEPVIAKSIESTLASKNYEIVATAFDYNEAVERLQEHDLDIVILDVNLQEKKDGIDVADYINEHKKIPFIFLTSYSSPMVLDRAKQTHPMGYITKPFSEQSLLASLEIALYNFSEMVDKSSLDIDWINERIQDPLSTREFNVLMQIYHGKNNPEIAEALFISINTVKTHVRKLYGKLNVSTRWELLVKLRNMK